MEILPFVNNILKNQLVDIFQNVPIQLEAEIFISSYTLL